MSTVYLSYLEVEELNNYINELELNTEHLYRFEQPRSLGRTRPLKVQRQRDRANRPQIQPAVGMGPYAYNTDGLLRYIDQLERHVSSGLGTFQQPSCFKQRDLRDMRYKEDTSMQTYPSFKSELLVPHNIRSQFYE